MPGDAFWESFHKAERNAQGLEDFAHLLHAYCEDLEKQGFDREEAMVLTQGFQVACLNQGQ